jgi:hypothetical protein
MTRLLTLLRRAQKERGATDPILIIAGIAITLILLVGGSFAISGFIGNANNLNAKGDLDRIATAQAAFYAEKDRYASLRLNIANPGTVETDLQNSSISFTPTADNPIIVNATATGWAAVTLSPTGEMFIRTSASSQIIGTTDRSVVPEGVVLAGTGITGSWVTSAMARVKGF